MQRLGDDGVVLGDTREGWWPGEAGRTQEAWETMEGMNRWGPDDSWKDWEEVDRGGLQR